MRKSIVLLCILGFTSLIVGSTLAIPPLREGIFHMVSIPSSGTIMYPDNPEPQETNFATTLDKIGYIAVLASIAFFTIAFLHNRKST